MTRFLSRYWFFLISICLSLYLVQCGKKKTDDIPRPDGEQTVVTYGSGIITVREVLIAFQESHEIEEIYVAKAQYMNTPGNPIVKYARGIADTTVFDRYLAVKARDAGLDQSGDFKTFTESVLKQELTQKLLLEEVLKKIGISEEEVKRFYEDNRESRYSENNTDAFEVRAIYVYMNTDTHTKEEAKALIDRAYQELSDGAPFEDVAKKYSDAPIQYKGTTSTITRSNFGELAPEILSRVLDLKDGQYSNVFEYNGRYYVYQRLKYIEPVYTPFEKVRTGIFKEMTQDLMNRGVFMLIEELRAKHGCLSNTALIVSGEDENPDAIVMSVPGSVELTLGQFNRLAERAKKITPQDKLNYLSVLSNEALFLAEAKSRQWTEKEFATALAYWQEKHLAQAYVQSELEKNPVTDEEIQTVYDRDRDKPELHTDPIYDLSHIFFPVIIDPSFSQLKIMTEFNKAEQQARKTYSELKDGASFDEIAESFSAGDPLSQNSGSLGHIPLTSLDQNARETIEKLKEGEFSEPVRIENLLSNRNGYEIFLVRGIEPSHPMSIQEASPVIKSNLLDQRRQELTNELKDQFDDSHPAKPDNAGLNAVAVYLQYLSTRPDKLADMASYEEPVSR